MRIALISPFLFRFARGIERFTWELAGALGQKGHQVQVLTWHLPSELNWGKPSKNVRVVAMPYIRYFPHYFAVPFYGWQLARARTDLAMFFFASFGEAETAIFLNKKSHSIVLNFQYPVALVPHRYEDFRRFDLYKRADRLVGISQFVSGGVEQTFKKHCETIYQGVNIEQMQRVLQSGKETRDLLQIHENSPVLITTAALEERKGIQWVLHALPHIAERYPDVVFLILGEGPYREPLVNLSTELQIQHHVKFLGAHTNVTPYLAAADIGLILAHSEAGSMTVLEYMAMELAVIVAKHPPFNELVKDERGIMVNEQDKSQVVDAVCKLLADPDLRRSMGSHGRSYVVACHSWSRIAQDYLALFQDVLIEKRQAQRAK